MKLNIDCIRDILLYCDQEDDAYIEYRTPWSFNGHEYSQSEMAYHVGLCNDAGFFHRACLDNVPSCEVEGLSFEGQKYLDTIRSESIFAKVKEEVKKKAVPVTLEVVKGVWALILPGGLMGAMNVLMVRNYYNANIPYSIIEAAGMDGASDLRIYTSIIVPLSKPVLATIGLFAAIGYWNNWTNGLYYISDSNLYTIQVYLKRLMDNIAYLKSSNNMVESASLAMKSLPTESARMAIAIIAIIPILLVYPFIQKQLVKGMVIGGVKG